MSFVNEGFLMTVIFTSTIIGFLFWIAYGPHTKEASRIQSESTGQGEDDCEWELDDKKYPLGMYGIDGPSGGPTPSPNVSIVVDSIKV